MTREDILEAAKIQVTGKRETDYGTPEDNFKLIARLWSDYMDTYISPLDVAMMMSLLKIARINTGKGGTDDCFVDLAGYSACGGEINTIGRVGKAFTNNDAAEKIEIEKVARY